jgi:type IV pilus assembly protein PilE
MIGPVDKSAFALEGCMPHLESNLGIPRVRRGRAGGFTLIEVMVVGVIVAILAAIALPSYAEYIRRSKISEAISNLSDMRTRLEQFYLDNRSYPADASKCKPSGAGLGEINLPAAQQHFSVSCSAMSPTSYTITATGKPSEGMSSDFKYTINQANARTSAGPAGHYTNTGCWAIRKDGSCT